MIWLRLSQTFSCGVLVFNLFMAFVNFTAGNYWQGALSLVFGVVLAWMIISIEWKIAKLRRFEREWRVPLHRQPLSAQKLLDECWKFGICPDCANPGLAYFSDDEAMCSEIGCNSRFRRDPKTGKWERIDG